MIILMIILIWKVELEIQKHGNENISEKKQKPVSFTNHLKVSCFRFTLCAHLSLRPNLIVVLFASVDIASEEASNYTPAVSSQRSASLALDIYFESWSRENASAKGEQRPVNGLNALTFPAPLGRHGIWNCT